MLLQSVNEDEGVNGSTRKAAGGVASGRYREHITFETAQQSKHPAGALTRSEWIEILVCIHGSCILACLLDHGNPLDRLAHICVSVRCVFLPHPHPFLFTNTNRTSLPSMPVQVRIAVCRDLQKGRDAQGGHGRVADAVEHLCREVLIKHLPNAAIEHSNHFRKLHCYIEPTSECLRKHAALCRALFMRHASPTSPIGHSADPAESSTGPGSAGLVYRGVGGGEMGVFVMTVGGWLAFVERSGLLGALTVQQAKHIFLRSRLRMCRPAADEWVGDDHIWAGPATMRCHLDATDWLEALVRLAMAIAPKAVVLQPTGGQMGCGGGGASRYCPLRGRLVQLERDSTPTQQPVCRYLERLMQYLGGP